MTRVLIVEDDDVIGRAIADHLQVDGFDALLVSTGEKVSRVSATSIPRFASSTSCCRESTAGL
jgi:DNA-binding response OmpR family regulator